MVNDRINGNCRFYLAAKPCKYNKLAGVECSNCEHVSEFATRILIVKLDALGDVLRTACLLPAIVGKHAASRVTWLTRPEAVPLVEMMIGVDEVLPLGVESLARISAGGWDWVYALSNDYSTASLATLANPRNPIVGYSIVNGAIQPSNSAALAWLQMAAFDRLKRANTRSYQDRMLDIIGGGEFCRPNLSVPPKLLDRAAERVAGLFAGRRNGILAINIGAGGRWPKKMLEAHQIVEVIEAATSRLEVNVLLVGGSAEKAKSLEVMRMCQSNPHVQPGLTAESLPEFVAMLAQADVLFCGDTLAMHVATALALPTVCVVGPTSNAELAEFDGLVVKTTASQLDCLGCYADCDKLLNCMSLLATPSLVALIEKQLQLARSRGSLSDEVARSPVATV